MMTGGQIGEFLHEHEGDKIYVGVDGFVPRLVDDFSEAIVNGAVLANDLGFVVLHGTQLHTVDRISIEGSGSRGFTVEDIKSYKDGFWLVFSIFMPRG